MVSKIFAQPYGTTMFMARNNQLSLKKDCFISILGTHTEPIFENSQDNILVLRFDDILPDKVKQNNQEGMMNFSLFTIQQADQITEFVLDMHNHGSYEDLYIHCAAGVSRSGAVAKFSNHILKLDDAEFCRNNFHIQPNEYVLSCLMNNWASHSLNPDK